MTMSKILIPTIRRVTPETLAQDIIGVQPMTGPAGSVYTMRTRYGDIKRTWKDYSVYTMRTRYGDIKRTWKDYLESLKWCTCEEATSLMQSEFPGPYTLQERFDNTLDKTVGRYYTMEWENDDDRIFWILKNT